MSEKDDDNVTSLAIAANDNRLTNRSEVLKELIKDIEKGETPNDGHMVVLMIDTGEKKDRWLLNYRACQIRSSEFLALVETARTVPLIDMGYLKGGAASFD